MNIKTVVMLGKPGAGKGMQSKMLADKTGYKIFSSGGRLREIASHETSLGKKIKGIIDEGHLMPYWFATYLFQEAILHTRHSEGIIYEGACRKKLETELFDEVMIWLDRPYKAIFINLPDKVVIDRLSKRREIEGRLDDSEEKIKVRLKVFENEIIPAIDVFKEKQQLIEVDGDGTPDEVHEKIIDLLENHSK